MPSTPEEKKRYWHGFAASEGRLMLWKEHLKMVLNAAPFSSKLLPFVAHLTDWWLRFWRVTYEKPLTRMTTIAMKSVNQLTIRLNWFAPILNSNWPVNPVTAGCHYEHQPNGIASPQILLIPWLCPRSPVSFSQNKFLLCIPLRQMLSSVQVR